MMAPVRHHYLLDLLRFLAALAVIVWHYQSFYYVAPGTLPDSYVVSQSPFFEPLRLFYYFGARAVEFFFVLSGFIFFWLYHARISQRAISVRSFAVLRLSRLYPLHALTLALVAVGQILARQTTGGDLVYPHNDGFHFVLHLLFASHWGLEKGWSFNAPVWSVSVEILLYAAFFVLAVLLRHRLHSIAAGLVLGICCVLFVKADIGWALICFFLGGLILVLYEALGRRQIALGLRRLGLACLGAAALGMAYVALTSAPALRNPLLYAVVFPMTVLFCALLQREFPRLGRRLAASGDLSYGVYLIHFPVQLLILLLVKNGLITVDFDSELVFLGFFATVMGLSVAAHIWFERPAKHWLRRVLLPARAAAPATS